MFLCQSRWLAPAELPVIFIPDTWNSLEIAGYAAYVEQLRQRAGVVITPVANYASDSITCSFRQEANIQSKHPDFVLIDVKPLFTDMQQTQPAQFRQMFASCNNEQSESAYRLWEEWILYVLKQRLLEEPS